MGANPRGSRYLEGFTEKSVLGKHDRITLFESMFWETVQQGQQVFMGVCLPIFALMGLGWMLDRRFGLDMKTLVKLNIQLFVPAFLFVKVFTSPLELSEGLRFVLFTLASIACMFLLSSVASALLQWPHAESRMTRLATMFYNCGNFGIPVTALAYPEAGPRVQVFVLMTMNISTFTLGLVLAGSREQSTLRAWMGLFRQPTLLGIALALLFRGWDIRVDQIPFVWKPANYLAEALVSFALITLGAQLSQTRPASLRGPLGAAVAIRLLGGPLVALFLTFAFDFHGEIAAVLILGASAPTAINTALLAHDAGDDSGRAAAAVFWTTLLSILTVTAVLVMLRMS